jgi:putative ABC transport system substrate-binding protein
MIDRRTFVRAAILLGFGSTLPARGQAVKKIGRIGYLSGAAPEADRGWFASFRGGLRELGYREGQDLVIESRHAGGRLERLQKLAEELVRLDIDVIVAYGAPSAEAARRATQKIPIVMCPHSDPLGTSLVASLARPGGNITGLTDSHAALVPKRLEILKEIAPATKRVAVLSTRTSPVAELHVKNIRDVALAAGVTILAFSVERPADFEHAFAAMAKERADALVIIADPMLVSHRERLAGMAVSGRLPAISTGPVWAHSGLLASYGTNFDDLFRRAATYVDKILKGANPADLPVEQPTKFDLALNLKTAKALGISLPRALVLRADQVIE